MASVYNTSSETSGSSLPEVPLEVISYIMEFLSLQDRISASQTCRLWYEASRAIALHRREVIIIDNNISPALKYLTPKPPRNANLPAPYFPNFSFGDIEIKCTGEMRNFWPMYGPRLKSLHLRICDISEKALSDCLKMCPLLETLHIQGSNMMFMSGNVLENVVHELRMPFLADIELRQINYLSDAILNRFVTIAPNLSRLALGDCRISFHEAVYLRFYTKLHRKIVDSEVLAGKIPLQVQKNVLTLQNIVNILTLRADTMKSISFSETQIDSHGLKKMCAVLSKASLKLETLELALCSQLQNGIEDVSESFSSSLKCLDLSYCRRVSSTSLAEIPKLTNLTKLNLSGCIELTDSIMRQFGCLINLRSLNLSAIERITGPAILEGLKPLHHLEHLSLNNMLQLDSDSILEILRTVPPLVTLELEYCQIPLMDTVLSILCQRHRTLKELFLGCCPMLSDIGLTGMAGSVPALTSLPAVDTTNGMKISLASKAEQHIVLEEKLKRIIEANLQPYEQQLLEENESAVMGIANMKSLKSLDLSQCNRVTDMSIKHFKFKELKSLTLQNNTNITDVSLQCLAVNCPNLQELWLQRCPRITDEGIRYLSRLLRLRILSLDECDQLTDASLEALMQTKSPLKNVSMFNCHKLSAAGVKLLNSRLRHPALWTYSESSSVTVLPPEPPPVPHWTLDPW